MRQRIRVKVDLLIVRVEAARKKAVEDHAKRMARYKEKSPDRLALLADQLKLAENKLRNGKLSPKREQRWDRAAGNYKPTLELKFTVDADEEPKLDLTGYDRDLSLLRMSAGDTILISVEDRQWSKYL